MEINKIRKDSKGNIISRENKNYHISFKEIFVDRINVESYKKYNIMDSDEYISKFEYCEEDDEEDENNKFNINDYEPLKLEKISMKNHAQDGYSTKCIIL